MSNTNNISVDDVTGLLALIGKTKSNEEIFNENLTFFATFIKLTLPAQFYFCSVASCPGHKLEGHLESLAQSRLFSLYLNGNGFSVAKAGAFYIYQGKVTLDRPELVGEETKANTVQKVDLETMFKAFFQLTPLCKGAMPVVVSEFKGKFTVKTRPQGDTDGDDGQSKESGKKSDKKDGRRKA
mgnify:CR=1 FL=1